MIDLHSHILPGIDDGPKTIDQSLELARAAVRAGMTTLVATPHVNRRYANDAATIAARAAELSDRLAAEEVGLEIRAGAEIALGVAVELDPGELRRLSLGGGPWLLVEPPFAQMASGLEIMLLDLQRRGHRIVLAHPERCPAFQREPRMLRSLVRDGVLTSITAGSLVGRFGGEVRRFATNLVAEGLVHNVASDAHDGASRAPGIADELAQSGVAALASWWTDEVPRAILSGEEIPSRPPVSLPPASTTRRRWSRLLRAG